MSMNQRQASYRLNILIEYNFGSEMKSKWAYEHLTGYIMKNLAAFESITV